MNRNTSRTIKLLCFSIMACAISACSKTAHIEPVCSFKGAQVTGISVTSQGRVFVNFPRWRDSIPCSVAEINTKDGSYKPFPSQQNQFLCVQSVVSFENKLYVLDTRNPQFKGVVDLPRIYVYDLNSDTLQHTIFMDSTVIKHRSYINDLVIDKAKNKIYLTDSGEGALVIIDLKTGKCRRILDQHFSTCAEQDYLTIQGKEFPKRIHADGIALDTQQGILYYHSLTAYSLYSISTSVLDEDESTIEKQVHLVAKTSAPDGMIFAPNGNIYYADLEHQRINYLTPQRVQKTLVESPKLDWADSFSIHDGYLYFTDSKINKAGGDVSQIIFTVNRIKI